VQLQEWLAALPLVELWCIGEFRHPLLCNFKKRGWLYWQEAVGLLLGLSTHGLELQLAWPSHVGICCVLLGSRIVLWHSL
jgi:hypothetical protein